MSWVHVGGVPYEYSVAGCCGAGARWPQQQWSQWPQQWQWPGMQMQRQVSGEIQVGVLPALAMTLAGLALTGGSGAVLGWAIWGSQRATLLGALAGVVALPIIRAGAADFEFRPQA